MENEKDVYLRAVYSIIKKRDGLVLTDKKTHFNETELRLLTEVLLAKQTGERLISTRIAEKLGITRSAVSQIVNRLEGEGVVRRVSDEVDKKIAYVEITEETLEKYQADIDVSRDFVGRVVAKFGKKRFEKMCADLQTFMDYLTEEKDLYLEKTTGKKKKQPVKSV